MFFARMGDFSLKEARKSLLRKNQIGKRSILTRKIIKTLFTFNLKSLIIDAESFYLNQP